ncbi:MAG: hypothetical protein ACRD6X_12630, partial [Pyrinomonadaceae bacterium]
GEKERVFCPALLDHLNIGIDKKGVLYVIPVQAKGERDKLGIVQIEQDLALCNEKLPDLVCRCIGAQYCADGLIALFELELKGEDIAIVSEKHYRLVRPDDLTREDLDLYKSRLS